MLEDGFFELIKPFFAKLLNLGNVGISGIGLFFARYRLEFRKIFDELESVSDNSFKKSLLLYRVHEDNYSLDRDAVERDFQKCYSRYSLERLKEIVESTNFSENEKEIILGKFYYRLNHINREEANER